MKCKHCGTEIIEGARFCPNCCAPIEYTNEEEEKILEKTEEREKIKKSSSVKNKYKHKTLTVCSLCLVFVVGALIFFDRDSGSITTEKVDKVADFLEVTDEEISKQRSIDLEEKKVRITPERPCIVVKEGTSKESYGLTFDEFDVIDKDSEKAIFYNIRNNDEYVLIKLSVKNRTYEDKVISALYDFVTYEDGKENIESKSGGLAESKPSIDGLVQRGQEKSGYVCYKVSEGWKKLEIALNFEGTVDEAYLLIENPKNREIKEEELNKIKAVINLEQYLEDNEIYMMDIGEEKINKIITDFMHLKALSRSDYIPIEEMQNYVLKGVK